MYQAVTYLRGHNAQKTLRSCCTDPVHSWGCDLSTSPNIQDTLTLILRTRTCEGLVISSLDLLKVWLWHTPLPNTWFDSPAWARFTNRIMIYSWTQHPGEMTLFSSLGASYRGHRDISLGLALRWYKFSLLPWRCPQGALWHIAHLNTQVMWLFCLGPAWRGDGDISLHSSPR